MSEDAEYLGNHVPDKLYINPGPTGSFATICGESEETIGVIDVTYRCKLAVKAFWVRESPTSAPSLLSSSRFIRSMAGAKRAGFKSPSSS